MGGLECRANCLATKQSQVDLCHVREDGVEMA